MKLRDNESYRHFTWINGFDFKWSLGKRKVSVRWVPRLFIIYHNRYRFAHSKECLALFNRNHDEFLCRFIEVNETWSHNNTSKQWVSQNNLTPKKAKESLSTNKVMTTVFEELHSIIHIDYLQKGIILNSKQYANVYYKFKDALKKRRRRNHCATNLFIRKGSKNWRNVQLSSREIKGLPKNLCLRTYWPTLY